MGSELLISLLLLLVAARVCGDAARRLGQPAVVGELLAGVLLGPAVLDLVRPSPGIEGVSLLGVFFLLLLAGMETRIEDLVGSVRGRGAWVPVLGFLLPLLLGAGVGAAFRMGPLKAAFLGLCLALTALPVSVRILMDLGKLQTDLGQRIVGTAVADDAAAYLLLGVLLSLPKQPAPQQIALASLKALLFLGAALGVFLLLRRLRSRPLDLPPSAALVFVLAFAAAGEASGFHFLAGVFFAAMLLGSDGLQGMREPISTAAMGFLAPVFFASLGLMMERPPLGALPLLAAVLAAAFLGKMLGGYLGGRLAGLASPESWTLGYGINARGLMPLVAADIARTAGLIEADLFSALVIMSLATTLAAPPLLKHAFSKLGQ